MQFEFDITENDLQQFYAFNHWSSPDRKRFRIKQRILVVIVMLATVILTLGVETDFVYEGVLFILIFASIFALVFGFFWAKSSGS